MWATRLMGVAEVPHIPNAPEKRGLFQRLQAAQGEEHGDRVTGTPWIASPFLRWGALGVAFISFSALLGYSALPEEAGAAGAPALSFFAVYLTDAPLPADLEGLIVSITRVGAGDPSEARTLDLRVRSFDLSKHHGVGDALPVATGYVRPSEREHVFIEFEAAVGLRGDEDVPLELSERFLHVEYAAAGSLSDRAAVLLDIDLERSVQEVNVAGERVLRFVPTVADVYEESLPDSFTPVAPGEPLPPMEPLFASAVPLPPVRQYRTASSPDLAPEPPSVLGDGPLDLDEGEKASSTPSDTSRSSTPPSSATKSSTSSSSTTSSSHTTTNNAPINHPPGAPHSPSPAPGSQEVDSDTLSWQGGEDEDGHTPSFEVFLSTSNPPPLMQATCVGYERTCTVNNLATGTTYYWRVRVGDGAGGVTLGDVWGFRTAETMCDRVGLEAACPVT